MTAPDVLIVSSCPPSSAGQHPDPATRVGCVVSGVGDWFTHAPGRVADLVAVWWPWLLAAAFAVVVLVLVVRVLRRRWWRRAVRRGYWMQLTPPRTLDPGQSGHVWRLLAGLARRTRSGWHTARPPLAFEVYGTGDGQLVAGLWLPRWVPPSAVLAEVARAWPGVRAARRTPPLVTGADGWRVAGYRLAATGTDLAALTDDPRPAARSPRGVSGEGDPLRAVLSGLARADGPAVLQVLARPATGKRLTALGHAARHGVAPRKPAGMRLVDGFAAVMFGGLRLLLDLITELFTTGRSGASGARGGRNASGELRRPNDPIAVRAVRDAADKLADGPHLLATIRVGVARPDAGFAATAARSLADGFITVSRALRPVRLRRTPVTLADRWAGRGDWLLMTATELGVLAHLPADPARYGFAVAALHRAPPVAARRAKPEHGTPRGPGWTRRGWTTPTDATDPDPVDAEESV